VIRLAMAGPHTAILSTLCARCPIGPTGCCASPPGIEWSDLGRIVSLGGRTFLLEQLAAGRLRPGRRGLLIQRVEPRAGDLKRCVFHGPEGCTIEPSQRAATCNYYVCEDALVAGGEAEGAGRTALEAIVALYGRWDLEIAERVATRWPEGPPWDEGFLDWLAVEYGRVTRAARRALRRLEA
jgi:hypothetical protein